MSLVLAQPQLEAIAAACRRHQVLRMERRRRPAKAAEVDQTGADGRSRWGWGYEQPGDQIKTRAAV
jgi:hypothetical protein